MPMLWLIGCSCAAGPEAREHHVVPEMVAEAQRPLGTSVVGVIDLWKQPEALTAQKKMQSGLDRIRSEASKLGAENRSKDTWATTA